MNNTKMERINLLKEGFSKQMKERDLIVINLE